jgi:hypothetical protein
MNDTSMSLVEPRRPGYGEIRGDGDLSLGADDAVYREPAGVNVRNIGSLAPGETKSRRIPDATGTDYYRYRCTIHSGFDQEGRCRGMCGKITAH